MLEVVEVKTQKQIKDFIEFPLKLYKDNPYFVPMLYSDEKALFKKDYYYYEQAEAVYYNCYKDGKMVGRINGIKQNSANKIWNQKRIRFTRFDCIDDPEVAKALFEKVEEWGRSLGMEEIHGPLGFSDQEREGLLIEGFDQMSTYEEQYNYPYYQKLIEDLGYTKDVDWVERRLYLKNGEVDERLQTLSQKIMDRYELKMSNIKSINKFIKRYADQLFDLIDVTYANIYGAVPFTEKQKKGLLTTFRLVLDTNHVAVITDKNDRVVCFAITFPAFGYVLQKNGGRLDPITIIRFLHALKHAKGMDLGLVGVHPDYFNKGVPAIFFAQLQRMMKSNQVEWADTNLNLEDNNAIQNQWKNFDGDINKRRRCFIKKL